MARSGAQEMRLQPSYTYGRYQGTLTGSSVALLTAGTSGTILVDSILLTEYSGVAKTATVRHVESGGIDDATANVLTATPLAANETVIFEGAGDKPLFVLKDADSLKALASAGTAVNIILNYRTQV